MTQMFHTLFTIATDCFKFHILQKGNIFIADYKILEDLPTKVIDGKPTAVTAALCLLYMNPQKKLLPIAIQVSLFYIVI